jgi:protoporphyrinogen oxidase
MDNSESAPGEMADSPSAATGTSGQGDVSDYHVVLLGAGVAGLAAAWRLLELRPGSKVTLLEADDHVGGLASRWQMDQFQADLGPHRVYTELPEIKALLPDLIASDVHITVPRRSELLLRGHYYQYPVRLVELLKRLGPVPVARLGLGAISGKAKGALRKSANYRDSMVAAFGTGVYNLIIGPYTRKVWKIDPALLSSEVARVRVSAGNAGKMLSQWFRKSSSKPAAPTALRQFSYIKGGVEGLVHSLEKRVTDAGGEIILRARVTGFERAGAKISAVHYETPGGPAATSALRCDAVISTIAITDLDALLQPLEPDPRAAESALKLEFIGLILVGVAVMRPQITQNSWVYFPEDTYVFNRMYEPRNFDPGMAPAGQALAVFEVTARWTAPLWNTSDDEVSGRVVADARRARLLGPDDEVRTFVRRVPYTYPLYTIDFRDHLQVIFQHLRQFENLVTTGRQGLFNHNNMDHSMLMGLKAAETIAQTSENPAGKWYDNLSQFDHFRIVD